jgi:transposase
MRKIKEVIRLKFEADLSHDRIAAATGVSKGTVTKYLQRAREVGLDWPLPEAMDDAQLQALLFSARAATGYPARPARLCATASGVEAQRGYPAVAVGGVCRRPPRAGVSL